MAFLPEEDAFCKAWLARRGWCDGEKIIPLIVRDDSYYADHGISRHNSYRHSDISLYAEVARRLTDMGYWVIRLSKKAGKRLDCSSERFIDYPFVDDMNDLLDIWLVANCHFVISTGTGVDSVADVYGKPVAYLNSGPLHGIRSWSRMVGATKHHKWKSTNQPLNVYECLEYSFLRTQDYDRAGIDLEPLTADEICEGALELEARLAGKWNETEEDRVLQEKFWAIFRSHPKFNEFHGWIHPEARMGTHFLRSLGPDFLCPKSCVVAPR
ncbi:MAG: TIGR04372 family glycosyltransferase [Spirochaetia bacterium]|nr:TIGR04372 family glycosyltransferase [Spirochaetia bacterium]